MEKPTCQRSGIVRCVLLPAHLPSGLMRWPEFEEVKTDGIQSSGVLRMREGGDVINDDDLNKIAKILEGTPIMYIIPDSPADKAGIKARDILLEVNGNPIPTLLAFVKAAPGRSKITSYKVWRDGEELEFTLGKADV